MKIGVIGLGVIGSACKYGFEKLGHEVNIHDIKFNTNMTNILNTEICFICVPTPSDEDGSCNVSIVESVVLELKDLEYDGIIAIKSTVKPTTTQNLIDKTKLKICFVPEFLRERSAISDFIDNHDLLVVGTDSNEIFEKVKNCHGHYPKKIEILNPTEAELLKYYSNTYNATKIIFANEMYEICEKLGINYTKIKDAFVKRGTTIDTYLDVNENFRGYAGVCLPKDTKALDSLVKELGLDLKLFEVIDSENNKFKKTVFNGMRLE
jgi:nucleotide sugar dehydrogenase